MKIRFIFLLLLQFSSIITYSREIDSSFAKKVAVNFYKQNSSIEINIINLVYTAKDSTGINLFYAFNINKIDGFVIVAADDAVIPILGYNTTGRFVIQHASPEFMAWIEFYKKQIEFVINNPKNIKDQLPITRSCGKIPVLKQTPFW